MTQRSTEQRQIVRFAFYKAGESWRTLSDEERVAARKELAEILVEARDRFPLFRTYSTVGTRADCDLLVWMAMPSIEDSQRIEADIRRSQMGRHLATPYSFLAMTKRSQYEDRSDPSSREPLRVRSGKARYLFLYPFVKTRAWYALPLEARQEMMNVHIEVGRRYPTVKLNTTYSFGLDDQEFVVAFETDEPKDFLDLVVELRGTKASEFTLRDTPIFTCVAGDPQHVLDLI